MDFMDPSTLLTLFEFIYFVRVYALYIYFPPAVSLHWYIYDRREISLNA